MYHYDSSGIKNGNSFTGVQTYLARWSGNRTSGLPWQSSDHTPLEMPVKPMPCGDSALAKSTREVLPGKGGHSVHQCDK